MRRLRFEVRTLDADEGAVDDSRNFMARHALRISLGSMIFARTASAGLGISQPRCMRVKANVGPCSSTYAAERHGTRQRGAIGPISLTRM